MDKHNSVSLRQFHINSSTTTILLENDMVLMAANITALETRLRKIFLLGNIVSEIDVFITTKWQ